MRIILGFFMAMLMAMLVIFVYIYDQVKESADKITHYNPKLTTVIYDKQGRLLANVFDKEHRIYLPYEKIPPRMIEALVAIEDTAFFEHKGVNLEAIFRAIYKALKAGKIVEGASTLTQQIIKNLALTREKTLVRKLKEAVLATIIEASLTKEKILEVYLNDVFLGHGYYGIKTAAKGYFHKEPHELTLKEIAILAGLPKAPSFYDPTKHYNLSLNRANMVIKRMYKLGWIDEELYETSKNEKPVVYDESRTQTIAPYLVDAVKKELQQLDPEYKTKGLAIYTTFDLDIQYLAEESLNYAHKKILERKPDEPDELNGAMVVMENQTGNVLALVGGVDYKKSSFNRATQSLRQPGSGFKPFVYLSALENGYSPAHKIADISRVYETGADNIWRPKNAGGSYRGTIALREALVNSRNLATINLSREIGLDIIHKQIEQMGFKEVPYNLSFVLGSFGISPLSMAEQYTILSNYGTKVHARLIDKIVSPDGTSQIMPTKKTPIVQPEQAYLVIDMMRDVVKRGTGKRARLKGIEIAGKTGTTNNNVDTWFNGYTPELEVLTWFGKDNNKPINKKESGGKTAAPAFKYFMERYLKMHPETKRSFDVPEGIYRRVIGEKEEIFTHTSKPPKITPTIKNDTDSEVMF
jgi:penicillin-binding protein 1A